MFFILVYHFSFSFCFFFFNDTATTEIYTLSLHDALPIYQACADMAQFVEAGVTTFDCADIYTGVEALIGSFLRAYPSLDRKSTRLNSSHLVISYAVFCLKKKKTI